jgi:hypothetical protein
MTSQRASSSYYLAAAVLLVAIGAFLALSAMVIRSPQRLSMFQADAPTAAGCPAGAKDDACFHLQLHNVGNAPGFVQCSLAPATGTTALFHTSGLPNADGTGGYQPSDLYSSSRAVEAGQGLILLIEVKADKEAKPTAPTGACLSVPAPASIAG